MNARTLILRKFNRRLSDLQLLVLLELGNGPAGFAHLLAATEASSSGVWNALALIQSDGLARSESVGGRVIYSLSDMGRENLLEVLK